MVTQSALDESFRRAGRVYHTATLIYALCLKHVLYAVPYSTVGDACQEARFKD